MSLASPVVNVIGAGLAGVEASLQLAIRQVPVRLYEMKKKKKSPAHQSDQFAELVCSNSLRSDSIENAVGLLKEELRLMGSFVIASADQHRIPAGSALAVDRERFSQQLTTLVRHHPLIEVIDEEVTSLPEGITIIASGPLTSEPLAETIRQLTGSDALFFYDAVAPIIEVDSIDRSIAYPMNRYQKGEGAYLNCPMTQAEYERFYHALIHAECVQQKEFELTLFEGCLPIEEMARRGEKTLLYGPLKPVGLAKPGEARPYAVCQLRQDDLAGSLYNLVGFQTHLTFSAQKQVIRLIPGLENAVISRYGVMHRNTFVNAPLVLKATYQLKTNPQIFIAGQLSGIEGYVESIGSGLIAGINAARIARGSDPLIFPQASALGSQAHYLASASPRDFQPHNVNFAFFPELEKENDRKIGKKERRSIFARNSLSLLKKMQEEHQFD
ncbi:MAG: methylenetetrahydrofolate--tRNA-(uracil(54)-C(5))-methyltransferase (FADH(2)-oxidizing) TrmFO [Candidatus Izemoplasmatales bacterium]|nr:methylenetetrahydrofolate--tRNA-(uracil(54)-C(5))-methyltransferase (FADH(2)-oxidizing) TrmFO [Candidatus Izemoplasmatales bacterium]